MITPGFFAYAPNPFGQPLRCKRRCTNQRDRSHDAIRSWACCVLTPILFVLLAVTPCHGDELSDQKRLLFKHGVETDAASLIQYLEDLQIDNQLDESIDAFVLELASDDWQLREAATKNLIKIGQPAYKKLITALKSPDPEVRWRAERALDSIDINNESYLRRSITLAVLDVLKSHGAPQAVGALLKTIPLVSDDQVARNSASEALWASCDASHVELFKSLISQEDVPTRAASVVALEIASSDAGQDVLDSSLQHIKHLLNDQTATIRLAAARAFIDHRPADTVQALIQLADDDDQEVAWKADALLSMKTGAIMKPADSQSLGGAWQQWADANLADADLNTVLGQRRLDLGAGRNWLDEQFNVEKNSVVDGYGQFEYESTNRGTAQVVDGKLRIDGSNEEGDQRLFITSQRMIASDRWPDIVEVRARLGGEQGGNYGWHMGISVGKVKVLYHPGESKGYFRLERTDTHEYITENEDLAFAPRTGVMQEMVVRVKKTDVGAVFDITVVDQDGKNPFNKRVTVTNNQLGKYNRIGLERSGRAGGGALFDSVNIRLTQ